MPDHCIAAGDQLLLSYTMPLGPRLENAISERITAGAQLVACLLLTLALVLPQLGTV